MSGVALPNSTRLKSKTSLVVAVALLLAGLTVAAEAWSVAGRAEPPRFSSPEDITPVAVPASAPSVAPQLLRITIRPTGFDPAEVSISQGRFTLAVDNRSGLRELTFRLDREGAGRLREVRMPRERLSYREVIDPPPGVYVLTEADHPTWVCRVRVGD